MSELPKNKMILYASGSFGSFLLYFMFTTYILYFYVDILLLPIFLFNLGFAVFGIVNAINDPIFGVISDRTKTKYGRRRPYILYMIIPSTIVWLLIWFPLINDPFLYDGLLFFFYFTIMICAWDSLYTLVDINQQALFPEMFSPEERPSVNSWRFVFAGLGLFAGVALPPIIAETTGTIENPNYGIAALIFGLLGLITYIFAFIGSKERPEHQLEEPMSLIEGLKRLGNRSFSTFVCYNLCVNFIAALGPGIIPFFMEYAITDYNLIVFGEISFGLATTIILGVMFIVGIISIPIWGVIIKKFGERKTSMIIAASYGVGFLPWMFVNSLNFAVLFAITLGPGIGGTLIIADILMSQIVDEDEIVTGKRREGMHYGFNNLIIRTSFIFYSLVSTLVFLITGYDADLTQQISSAVLGIRLLESVFPALAICLAILFLYLYPLHGKRWEEIKQKQIEIQKLKKEKYQKEN